MICLMKEYPVVSDMYGLGSGEEGSAPYCGLKPRPELQLNFNIGSHW